MTQFLLCVMFWRMKEGFVRRHLSICRNWPGTDPRNGHFQTNRQKQKQFFPEEMVMFSADNDFAFPSVQVCGLLPMQLRTIDD